MLLSFIAFQIKESPEGDWNDRDAGVVESINLKGTFKLKNPRKGTETYDNNISFCMRQTFKLKNPRKGTETLIITILSFWEELSN